MSTQSEVNDIMLTLKNAVASAINQKDIANLVVEIQELKRIATVPNTTIFAVNGTYKVPPFFGGRNGKIFAILTKFNQKFEISELRIDEKGLQ